MKCPATKSVIIGVMNTPPEIVLSPEEQALFTSEQAVLTNERLFVKGRNKKNTNDAL